MPTLLARDFDGLPVQALRPGTAERLAVGAASAQSAAVGTGVRVVRVCSTVSCYVAIGTNPTATADSLFLPANWPEWLSVLPGDKIAALQVSSGGHLSIVQMG